MIGGVVSAAEISSVATSLDELAKRVTTLAEQARLSETDEAAAELFNVERSLQGALRRLRRLERPR